MTKQSDTGFIKKLIAKQLRRPSGWPVGWVMLGMLNDWNREMNQSALSTMDISDGDCILELGCGGGGLIELIANKNPSVRIFAIDWAPLAIRYCKRRFRGLLNLGRLELSCEEANSISREDNSIDSVCSVNTAYFWDSPESVLVECARILKPGGRIVLCNVLDSEMNTGDYPPEYFNSHGVEDVTNTLLSLGFSKPAISYGRDKHAKYYTLTAKLGSGQDER